MGQLLGLGRKWSSQRYFTQVPVQLVEQFLVDQHCWLRLGVLPGSDAGSVWVISEPAVLSPGVLPEGLGRADHRVIIQSPLAPQE